MMFWVRLLSELMILLSAHTHPARNIPGIFSAIFWAFREHLGNTLKENIFKQILNGKVVFVLKVYDLTITNVG